MVANSMYACSNYKKYRLQSPLAIMITRYLEAEVSSELHCLPEPDNVIIWII